ncbi:hypothetical protein DQ04_04851040 [Trypanosoma grayi]|uniref:hypothetical protein n=1 Tax=Trypanosoma grayi TaxID=71804 RepID=UPI0004F47CE5|nr:hypothetical protein DQ04_04851040 [Trypanosoma grayi]KEG09662.1 hypothetical protein DQ04_04851040 [Trypanosoma grayi]
MGLPDFLKFVARASPAALCRIPKGGGVATLCFDFVLIDATNAHQTIGLETLAEFLKQPQLQVRRAIIFAMDAQRHRAGTSRSHRTHTTVIDADVAIQQLCCELERHYRQRPGGASLQILISGRQVAGEADYKILDMQRQLVTQALAAGAEVPTFCLISEDSDVLCGALCGPAPHTVSIATKLHDTMFEMCVLRLTHVLAYIAVCVEALSGENEEATGPPLDTNTPISKSEQEKLDVVAVEEGEEEEDVVRRKKQDGPMVATGACVALSDSDSDGEDGEEAPVQTLPTSPPTITAQHISTAEILQNSCVDLVFLFVVVMGNGGNVPPVIRGVTKVDIQSCWKMYCQMKYNTAEPGREKEMGRSLLCLHDAVERTEQQSNRIASVVVDCSFLRGILEATHYADTQSRPPVEEEKERALLFLSQAVYTTMRYIIACNLHPGVTLKDTFLDARPLMETEVAVPSLAAFLWVLGQSRKKTLYFPLVGLATEGVLSSAPKGMSAVEAAVTAAQSLGKQNESNVMLQCDVANTLVTSGAGTSHTVQLQSLFLQRMPSSSRKGIVACINDYIERSAGAGDAPTAPRLALFSRLIATWQRTVAPHISTLENVARREHFVSPFTGTVMGGDVASTSAGGGPSNRSKDVKMSYSFELRRMAPVLSSHDKTRAGASTQNSALFHALRVSYDYVQAPPQALSANAVDPTASMPTVGRNKKNKPHLRGDQREAPVATTVADGTDGDDDTQPPKKRTKTVPASDAPNTNEMDGDHPGKYRRPGKKEREKLKRKYKS